jgi:hypothetical protein
MASRIYPGTNFGMLSNAQNVSSTTALFPGWELAKMSQTISPVVMEQCGCSIRSIYESRD